MNTKKTVASLVGVMLIATILAMGASAAGFDRDKYLGMPRMVYEFDAVDPTGIYVNYGPDHANVSVRVYGEEDAIYPTQSYTEEDDFIYPNHVDPFDPGVIGKCSVTFNPAYMYNAASVDGDDDLEHDMKAFFRVFYEPGYDHVVDDVMANVPDPDGSLEDLIGMREEGALVTETTYMLVWGGNVRPMTGAADDTRFNLPTNSANSMDTTPGMDVDEIVDLLLAEDGDFVTDGTIEVGVAHNVPFSNTVRFMDHEVTFTGCLDGNTAMFDVSYIGNTDKEVPATKGILVPNDGSKVYVERYNKYSSETNPAYRWFIIVTEMSCDEWCDVIIGRRLVAGETFYVDSVRYDMPAVYVADNDEFKYITFQSPLPKCTDCDDDCEMWKDGYDANLRDWSHVSCQWLARLLPKDCESTDNNVDVWVLPPFNRDHTMIDDIGLPKTWCTGGVEVDENGDVYGGVPELLFHYIKEDTEERFNTSLAERHHIRKDGVEIWNWWSVFTKPYHYVELVLPNDEDEDDGLGHDGYEYLITTSFIAPNCEAEERGLLCKSNVEVHDIIDRAATIAVDGDDRRDAYANMSRMVFEFAGDDTDDVDGDGKSDGEDLFVNWHHHPYTTDYSGAPTVRVYGEEGAIYPTHSFMDTIDGMGDLSADFIYPNHVDPFDPGVIGKDSVTLNPVYIDDEYEFGNHIFEDNIVVDYENGDEKVFMRLFYEPGYGHSKDKKMSDTYSLYPVEMLMGALVLETTYMLVNDNQGSGHSGEPKAGRVCDQTGQTHFMLPVAPRDMTDLDAGMDVGDMVDLVYAMNGDILTNGTIEVEQTYNALSRQMLVGEEYNVTFMDHVVYLTGFNGADDPVFAIGYTGNMHYAHPQVQTLDMQRDDKLYFSRGNLGEVESDPAHRWYLEVTEVYGTHVDIKVGRRLVAGETFYVDGVRYDMPAIYVTDNDGIDPGIIKFKYITFQSPMPKCEGAIWYDDPITDNQKDYSHVTSQWLANILEKEMFWEEGPVVINHIPVLPPFNEPHTMIDDIGLAKFNTSTADDPDWEICTEAGNIIVDEKDPLKFYYINELEEWRFNTSLAEIHAYGDWDEIWNWWSIFTKPYQYTELLLPNQEDATTDFYEDLGCPPVDGNEYLITTSFIAPNCEAEARVNLSKPSDENHDIIDRAATLLGGAGPGLCGDVNCDGSVNMGDVNLLRNSIGLPGTYSLCDDWAGDVNCDGSVNMGDVNLLRNSIGLPGTYSLNCCP